MKRISLVVGVVLLLLVVPGSALASGSSTCQAYSPQLCSSVGSNNAATGSGSGTGANSSSAGSLPFTGLDVVLLVAGGATLLGAGLLVRALSRRLTP
jgi:hypothetical protein